MGYLERIFAGASPVDCLCDTFISIRAWLAEKKVDADEAEYLADMTRKVDWNDFGEKTGFVELMEYLSGRSSMSEDLSWAAVVGLDWNWLYHSDWLSTCIELYVFAPVY